jgi:hypothetical protein
MKRIRYASRFAKPMLAGQIEALAREAAEHNARNDITGLLIASGDLFFQIIEGPRLKVDELYGRILQDPRHTDVVTLMVEQAPGLARLCPDWAMRKIDLGLEATERMEPVRALLGLLVAHQELVGQVREALERTTWRIFLNAELEQLHRG